MSAYGTFISNTPQIIALGGSVDLNAALSVAPVGMTFTPGTPTVTINTAGVYNIDYRILTTLGVGASMVLLHNGAAVANSAVTALVAIGEIAGIATLALSAGDTIAIGTTGLGVTLAAGTNAFLDVVRIA